MRISRIFLTGLIFLIAIQAAIGACVEPAGKITSSVTFCKGTYDFDSEVVVTGVGVVVDCDGATLRGTSSSAAIVLNSTLNAVVKNCVIEGAMVGIYLMSSPSAMIESNILGSNQRGIYVHKSSPNVRVKSNTIKLSSKEGIGIESNGGLFDSNTLEDNFYGLYIYNESSSNYIRYNLVTGNTFGAFIVGKNNWFGYNVVEGNGDGVRLVLSSGNTILGNRISGNTQNGLFSYISDKNTITQNNITMNQKSGAVLYRSTQNIMLQNTIDNNLLAGLFVTDGSHKNNLSMNIFSKNGLYAIDVNASNMNHITKNTIVGSSFQIESNSVRSVVCPENIYSGGASGPSCGTAAKTVSPVIPTQTVAPMVAPIVEPKKQTETPDMIKGQDPGFAFDATNNVIEAEDAVSQKKTEEAIASKFRDAIIKETSPKSVQTKLSSEDIQSIIDKLLEQDTSKDKVLAKKELIEKIRKTETKVIVQKSVQNYKVDDKIYTVVNTTIRVTADMTNLHVYENIPKDCAAGVEDILFNQGIMARKGVSFSIVEGDPLIVWKFDNVKKGEEISLGYTIKSKIEQMPKTIILEGLDGTVTVKEDLICDQVNVPKSLLLADKIRAFSWFILIPIGLIILVPVMLVYFTRGGQSRQ